MNDPVFLDRDGVINELVYNPSTDDYEAPQQRNDLKIFPGAVKAIKELAVRGFRLFIITNQPDYAKGKTSMEELQTIHEKMHKEFIENDILFTEYYYCYQHPDSVLPELRGSQCRKPNPYFLREAEKKYSLDLNRAWMVGDSDVDIFAGKSVGAETILVENPHSVDRRKESTPDNRVKSLEEAVQIIIKRK